MAVQAPLPAVVRLLSTGGNSSTPMVISFDRCSPVAPAAAVAAAATDPIASALTMSAAVMRFLILRDVADIGGPQLRRRMIADACHSWMDGRSAILHSPSPERRARD